MRSLTYIFGSSGILSILLLIRGGMVMKEYRKFFKFGNPAKNSPNKPNKMEPQKSRRIFNLIFIFTLIILSLSFISAGNISLFTNNIDLASTNVAYTFNFTNSTNCNPSNNLLNYTRIITFNSRGVGFVSLDITNLTSVPVSLCEGRDGVLRKNHSFSDIVFNQIYAVNLNLSGDAIIRGYLDVNGDVILSGGAQSYNFTNRLNTLAIQSQTSGTESLLELYTKDGDGTDELELRIFAVGTPGNITNREFFQFGYSDVTNTFDIETQARGTGVARDIKIIDNGTVWMTFHAGAGVSVTGEFNATSINISEGAYFATSSGNVGIGTTTPTHKLNVVGIVNFTSNFLVDTNTLFVDSNNNRVGIGTIIPAELLDVDGNAVVNRLILDRGIQSPYIEVVGNKDMGFFTADNQKMIIEEGGNVGIGLTNPTKKLHVVGDMLFKLTTSSLFNIANSSGTSLFIVNEISGNVGIGTTSPSFKFHLYETSDEVARFSGEDHAIISVNGTTDSERSINFLNGSDIQSDLQWKVGLDNNNDGGALDSFIIKQTNNVAPEFIIDTSGNVGIGTTAPDEILTLGSGTTTGNKAIHIEDHDDAFIFLEADEDNVGEDDNAYIKFSQDNTLVQTIIGSVGNPGFDPENIAYTGTLANAFLIGTLDTNGNLQFGTNDTVRMTIEVGGNVGIGTTTPNVELTISDGTDEVDFDVVLGDLQIKPVTTGKDIVFVSPSDIEMIRLDSSQLELEIGAAGTSINVGIGTNNPTDALTVVGDINVSGCIEEDDGTLIGGTCVSDIRLKKEIEDYNVNIDNFMSLQPRTFEFKDKTLGNGVQVGFIAQEVEKFYPERVVEEEGIKKIKYNWNWIIELIKIVQNHESRLLEIERENDMLKSELCLRDNTYSWC